MNRNFLISSIKWRKLNTELIELREYKTDNDSYRYILMKLFDLIEKAGVTPGELSKRIKDNEKLRASS